MRSQPIPKPPTKFPTHYFFIRNVAVAVPQPLYLGVHKVLDQPFQIDHLERSVNTDARSPGEWKFLTNPEYEILSDVASQ